MNDIATLLTTALAEGLSLVIISNPKTKTDSEKPLTKVKIKPILMNKTVCYQAEEQRGTQAFHVNLKKTEVAAYIEQMMTIFGQLQLQSMKADYSCLVSNKGKVTIKKHVKAQNEKEPVKLQSHNRQKQYIINEGTPVPFLVDLGVMTKDGAVTKSRYDKFRQINRFLEYIRDILPSLPRDRELTIIDFGCGKSYLTFAVYYYLHELEQFDVRIIGLDLKKDVIDHMNKVSKSYGYDKLSFLCGDIADYEGVTNVDLVITLHACDTATDYALAKAVNWGALAILSVPCCQHELNKQMDHDIMDTVLSYGILRERTAAILTDGIRGQVLEAYGYHTQLLEFIDMSHTPKNLLIRAVKDARKPSKKQVAALMQIVREYHLDPTILKLLPLEEFQ